MATQSRFLCSVSSYAPWCRRSTDEPQNGETEHEESTMTIVDQLAVLAALAAFSTFFCLWMFRP